MSAPVKFQRVPAVILSWVECQAAFVYIDDIVIFSKSLDEHIDHVWQFLILLNESAVTLKLWYARSSRTAKNTLATSWNLNSRKSMYAQSTQLAAYGHLLAPRNLGLSLSCEMCYVGSFQILYRLQHLSTTYYERTSHTYTWNSLTRNSTPGICYRRSLARYQSRPFHDHNARILWTKMLVTDKSDAYSSRSRAMDTKNPLASGHDC